MFSRRTSGRFPREPSSEERPGPGSYDLPSTLEKKARAMDGPDRWSETSIDVQPGPGNYDPKAVDKGSDPSGPCSPPSLALACVKSAREKENHVPGPRLQKGNPGNLSARGLHQAAATAGALPRGVDGRTRGPPTLLHAASAEAVSATVTAEAKQKRQDLKLASQLDGVRDELKVKSREAKELCSQLSVRDRKVEELQKKVDELMAQRREAHRHTMDVESERDAKRRQVHEKEQDILALQRKLEHLRTAAEERARRTERTEEAMQAAVAEAKRFRDGAEVLQDKLAAAERDRKSMDAALRQQQRRSQELEVGMKEHAEVLEESLRREEARRRELEERAARSGAEQEHGEAELAAERRHVRELQSRVAHLEAEQRAKFAQVEEWGKERERLEGELLAAKARNAAHEDAIVRHEDRRQELETKAARAQVEAESKVRELQKEGKRVAELEAEVKSSQEQGEAKLRAQAEELEAKARTIMEELEEERHRSEQFERRIAAHEEQEREHERALASSVSMASLRQDNGNEKVSQLQTRLELAEEELQRWKEWADEQSLRELTAETQRLEEIKKVREDVGDQVEAAKKEVVAENNELQKRICELEKGPEGAVQCKVRLIELEKKLCAHSDALSGVEAERERLKTQAEQAVKETSSLRHELDAARRDAQVTSKRAEEQRREMEASLLRAQADRIVMEEDFAEERERLEAQIKALRVQHETAFATQGQEIEIARSAEREAWSKREQELERALGAAKACSTVHRWQLIVEAMLQQRHALDSETSWAEVRTAAARWRALARGHEKDATMLARQTEELERFDSEAESLRDQNKHILLSLQSAQQELLLTVAECRTLREREDAYEQEVDRISGQNAALGGHSNPKQKIKHLMAVKEENQALRQELKKNKLQVVQLESQLRSAQFFDTACDGASATAASSGRHTPARPKPKEDGDPSTPSRAKIGQTQVPRMPGLPRTPSRSGSSAGQQPTDSRAVVAETLAALADDRPEAARRERAEALRQARAHRRASERAVLEYQHLATMVEQALATGCLGSHASGGVAPATAPTSGTTTPKARPQPTLAHTEGAAADCSTQLSASCVAADPGALLERLRRLSASSAVGGS